jgi:hypothetical protein
VTAPDHGPPRPTTTRWRRLLGAAFVATLLSGLTSCVGHGATHTTAPPPSTIPTGTTSSTPSALPSSSATPSGSPTVPSGAAPVFAFYYLWWDRRHWTSHLGAYPYNRTGEPLPASLGASQCATVSGYRGNVETDVSPGLRYDQSNPATIIDDVRLAARTGLTGFLVNWVGTGQPQQSPSASSLDTRLKYVISAVHQVNAEGLPFKIILNYQSSARRLSTTQFVNDFNYFLSAYGSDPALDHSFSPLPEVVMAGTWKYSDAELATISKPFRGRMYLIGDEKPSSWDAARAQYLDGTSYYWSSQNPITNAKSFDTLTSFAQTVRATPNPDGRPKTWLAPFTPGYNAMLLYHTKTCVPRDGGRTMRTLFAGNAASRPDGWTLISWNEITEGTYVVPLTRYGTEYLDVLRSILRAR